MDFGYFTLSLMGQTWGPYLETPDRLPCPEYYIIIFLSIVGKLLMQNLPLWSVKFKDV